MCVCCAQEQLGAECFQCEFASFGHTRYLTTSAFSDKPKGLQEYQQQQQQQNQYFCSSNQTGTSVITQTTHKKQGKKKRENPRNPDVSMRRTC